MKYKIAFLFFVVCSLFILALASGCGSSGSSATTTTTATTTSTTTTTSGGGTTTTTTATTTTTSGDFGLTSSAFTDGNAIPLIFAYTEITGGLNTSVPLAWSSPPAGTLSFVLRMVDTAFDPVAYHWVVIDIPSTTTSIASAASGTANMPSGCQEVVNDVTGLASYEGPWPPSGETHTYQFTLYALNTAEVDLDPAAAITNTSFNAAVNAFTLEVITLSGTFEGS